MDGQPLINLGAQPWAAVRYWLLDLADEVEAGLTDGSTPVLGLDRIWITSAGHAKLLDWPVGELESIACNGSSTGSRSAGWQEPQ